MCSAKAAGAWQTILQGSCGPYACLVPTQLQFAGQGTELTMLLVRAHLLHHIMFFSKCQLLKSCWAENLSCQYFLSRFPAHTITGKSLKTWCEDMLNSLSKKKGLKKKNPKKPKKSNKKNNRSVFLVFFLCVCLFFFNTVWFVVVCILIFRMLVAENTGNMCVLLWEKCCKGCGRLVLLHKKQKTEKQFLSNRHAIHNGALAVKEETIWSKGKDRWGTESHVMRQIGSRTWETGPK